MKMTTILAALAALTLAGPATAQRVVSTANVSGMIGIPGDQGGPQLTAQCNRAFGSEWRVLRASDLPVALDLGRL